MSQVIVIELMRQQKNAVFEAIRAAELLPDEFGWVEEKKQPVRGVSMELPKLVHRPTDSYFLFGYDRLERVELSEWQPGRSEPKESDLAPSWAQRQRQVEDWLDNIKREFYEPDLWEHSAAILGASDANDDAPFSSDERADLSKRLRQVLDFIAEQRALSTEEKKQVEIRLVLPLEEASGKLTRGQVKVMLVGALVTEGVRVGFQGDTLHHLFHFAAQVLGHLFGGGMPQLPVA